MNSNIQKIIRKLESNAPATQDAIKIFEKASGLELPKDYINFLLKTNGAEGFIGDNYVIFWAMEELVELNKAYEVDEYKPELLLFGSNGGGEAFAFNKRSLPMKIVQIPSISIDLKDAIQLGYSFYDFLNILN
jgi:SMI1 / KNR4 family (SUKH-1)